MTNPPVGTTSTSSPISPIHAGKYFSTRLGGRLLGMIQDLTFVGEALLLHTDCDDATLRQLAHIDQTLRGLKDRIHPATPDTTAAQRARPISAISNPPSAISPQI